MEGALSLEYLSCCIGWSFLLQGIFPTWGLNPGLLYCIWILYHLSHQESPRIIGENNSYIGVFI